MRHKQDAAGWPWLWAMPAAICAGLAIGIGTQILQGALPTSWGVLANSGVVWALGAFAIGTLMPTDATAAVGGAIAMALAAVSYYWAVDWFEGISSSGTGPRLWAFAGLIAGSFFGLSGRWARRRPGLRWLAIAPVGGIHAGEGAHLIWFVGVDNLWPAGLAELILAAAVLAMCLVRERRRLAVLAIFAAACACFLIAVKIIDAGFA